MTKCETCGKDLGGRPSLECFSCEAKRNERRKVSDAALTLLADDGFCERMADWFDEYDQTQISVIEMLPDTATESDIKKEYLKIAKQTIRKATQIKEGEKDG